MKSALTSRMTTSADPIRSSMLGCHSSPALMQRSDQADTNAAIWKSAEAVKSFAAQADQRERERREQLLFIARLLPFKRTDAFTFLDLGAGMGAACGVVSDLPRPVPQRHAGERSPEDLAVALGLVQVCRR